LLFKSKNCQAKLLTSFLLQNLHKKGGLVPKLTAAGVAVKQ
jgi:hypothetical protein